MPENRIRKKCNLTLDPAGVKRLLAVGKAMPDPIRNRSRLVDWAIAEFVWRREKPSMGKGKK